MCIRDRLRSTGSTVYILPRTRTKLGERGFFYSGPATWNTLPSDLHDITDTSTFRKRLKNVLFDRAYNWLLLALLDVSYSGALQISHWLIGWLIDYTLSASCSHTKQCNLVMDKKCRCSAAEKMTADLAQSNGTRYIMSEIKIFAFGWE